MRFKNTVRISSFIRGRGQGMLTLHYKLPNTGAFQNCLWGGQTSEKYWGWGGYPFKNSSAWLHFVKWIMVTLVTLVNFLDFVNIFPFSFPFQIGCVCCLLFCFCGGGGGWGGGLWPHYLYSLPFSCFYRHAITVIPSPSLQCFYQ